MSFRISPSARRSHRDTAGAAPFAYIANALLSVMMSLTSTSCCLETVAVPDCADTIEPNLLLRVVRQVDPEDLLSPELPFLVAGRACGGETVAAATLAADYEIVVYVKTDKYYIQPFADHSRHSICPSGYFRSDSHEGNEFQVFLARAGQEWPLATASLPAVDGMEIVAEATVIIDPES